MVRLIVILATAAALIVILLSVFTDIFGAHTSKPQDKPEKEHSEDDDRGDRD
jgi:hypothetical protein